MENENFNLSEIDNMMNNLSKKQIKTLIDKNFIPLDDGTHGVRRNGKWEIFDTKTLKNVYFNRMSKELNEYYFCGKKDIRTKIYDINKPTVTETELNMCPKIKHNYVKYETFNDKAKEGVDKMLNHLKEVWCSNQESVFNFLIKWIANMLKGNKNTSCLYVKAPQGCGKTMPIDFMRVYVIGEDLCLETGSGPLKTKFNSELAGKLMVSFEELENFGISEWISISSVLKRIITSPIIMIEGKGVDPVKHKNINNYILVSNNDAITDDDGRRYFILPVNTKHTGNHKYFDDLAKACHNDVVGHAFYCYMMEINTENFNPQDYPLTSSKQDSFVKRLDNVYKYLKDVYILHKEGIKKTSVSELHEEYLSYCKQIDIKGKGKIDFNKTLENIGIIPKKSNGYYYYTVPFEKLSELAEKNHWIHELDEIKERIADVKDDDYENGIEKKDHSVDIKKELKEMKEKYEKEINDLKEKLKKYEQEEKPKKKTEEEKPKKKIKRIESVKKDYEVYDNCLDKMMDEL